MVNPDKAKRPSPSRKNGKAALHDQAVMQLEQQTSGGYIAALSDADILLGRGAPVQRRAANRRFRELVWEHKPTYDATRKHAVKDKIARQILDTVKERGGRFVRPIETKERFALKVPDSEPEAWVAINEDLAREKCKQALRDAVPPSPSTKEKHNPPSQKTRRKRKRDHLSKGEISAQRKKGPSTNNATKPRSPVAGRSDSASSNKNITTGEDAHTLPQVSISAALKSLPMGKDQSTLFDDDELSFRLKHPSLRKRDLSRMRHQRKQKPANAQRSTTTKPAAALVGIAGPTTNNVEHRGVSISVKCEKHSDVDDDDDQVATSSLSCSSSSDDEAGLDRKPRALKDNR